MRRQEPGQRLKALAAFETGEADLMVATGVAARGLDIADLPVVIDFDAPFHAEDHVHRIGCTGTDAPLREKSPATPGAVAAPAEKLLAPNIRPQKKVASLLGGGD